MECLRCGKEIKLLKEYRFDSKDNNGKLLKELFDIEEHLIFNIYICSNCNHTEFIYVGNSNWIDF
ncbi:zinc ribbon domain-containing protein [Faecalimicrobium sp. JNUCC 81]